MIEIGISTTPNQSLSVLLDDSFYDIELRQIRGVMTASIVRDGIKIISNTRILPGILFLPYEYQEHGNFGILTDNDEFPQWEKFNKTQFLIYFSPEEMAEMRGANGQA